MTTNVYSDYLEKDNRLKEKWSDAFRKELAKEDYGLSEKARQLYPLLFEYYQLSGNIRSPIARSRKEINAKLARIKEIKEKVEELING